MILDTNALSAFADGVSPVVQQIAAADELHVPVIVLGEYRFGIATYRRRRDRVVGSAPHRGSNAVGRLVSGGEDRVSCQMRVALGCARLFMP